MKKIRQDIEVLRLISALGIVWYHSGARGANIGYSGLIFFVILSVFLVSHKKISIQKRARRLLLPWLIWFVFYGVLNKITDEPFVNLKNGFLPGILAGSLIHLWYLPFIFIVLVTIDVIKNIFSSSTLAHTGAILAIILLIFSDQWREPTIALGYPWEQYAHATPAVLIGLFFRGFDQIGTKLRTFLLLLILFASIHSTVFSSVGIPYTIGAIAFSSILLYPLPIPERFNIINMSKLSLGIYLIHPFLLMVAHKLSLHPGILLSIIIFLASSLLIWILTKSLPNISKYAF
ncbi:MAG: acyltransferase family protein [Oscillatoriales cyanobacterium SM2_3_0]|nr:acyltransferase family protein [Oscillatoriales cyanobacterium SM2_3_0]